MRTRTIAIFTACCAVGLSACGSAGSLRPTRATPPVPISLSAYVSPNAVRVDPARLGAGPVLLTIANQSATAATVRVTRAGSAGDVARTAPINPDGATQVKVQLAPGRYSVAVVAAGRRTDAAAARGSRVRSAQLRVGAERTGGGQQTLLP